MTNYEKVLKEIQELHEKKNHDYGDSFHETWDKFGLTMVAIRLHDKCKRLETLSEKDAKVKDESIRDTLLDICNYAAMAVAEIDADKPTETVKICGMTFTGVYADIYKKFIRKFNATLQNKIVSVDTTTCPNGLEYLDIGVCDPSIPNTIFHYHCTLGSIQLINIERNDTPFQI